ncbi:PP2C family serine/threonine-protein phosphatase [Lyngbya sp. CCY1209]|uniref:PP2C family serine/threonine-protein phosphatase n=1 Tax=Lyngbya sp. CCY1209 TaxID=2886103 RepID=UPI002D2091CC|nr:PP2C family serine/threonine-protein phosphatase [Lyngbya sp. CCY1209]MEB3882002.1 protein phosphatase 2C domain-containing protein [Lyngbya sp. CCY1209]
MNSKKSTQLIQFGASVRGPLHQQENRPNEDAWEKFYCGFGTGIIVSDGMGSKPNARQGSRMACRAVKQALRPWSKAPGASLKILLQLIHLHWDLLILPESEKDSVATCLFAVVVPSGELIVAQLGDGIAALREPDGQVMLLNSQQTGFGNQTTGLGIARSTQEWSAIGKPDFSAGSAVFLATDGIADDLKPDSIGDFINVLITDFGQLSPQRRGQLLSRELRNWPTPKHLDDKTLAVLWHPPKN